MCSLCICLKFKKNLIILIDSLCYLDLEGSTSEDIRLLLEGSSYKHEPTKFSGMVFAYLFEKLCFP